MAVVAVSSISSLHGLVVLIPFLHPLLVDISRATRNRIEVFCVCVWGGGRGGMEVSAKDRFR